MRRLETSSRENMTGIQHGQNSVWGYLMSLVNFMEWLATFIQLTEAEQEEAGIHIEHQGGE